MTTIRRPLYLLATLTACAWIAGCASPRAPLYAWDGYQSQVYAYLKDDGKSSADEQLLALEEMEQKALGKGQALPPGFNAHMAMLYAKTGNNEKSVQQLNTEKQRFPESTRLIDRLLQSFVAQKKD